VPASTAAPCFHPALAPVSLPSPAIVWRTFPRLALLLLAGLAAGLLATGLGM
jgi:hypothetical protein